MSTGPTRTDTAQAPMVQMPTADFDLAQVYADSLFWLQTHWGRIIAALVVAVAIMLVLRSVRSLGVWLCRRDHAGAGGGWWQVAGRTLARTGRFFNIMVGLELARHIADPPALVSVALHTLFTVAAVFQGALWARELILGAVEQHSAPDSQAREGLASALSIIRLLVTFAVFAIALVVVLDNVGVNVTGLIAGLGVGGIAIGLAAQGIFADLFAALAIIFDRPFRRGDVISFDQTTGTVEEIGLKSTRVRPPSGEEHIIANKQLLEKEIQNITQRSYRRVSFTLAIAAYTPADRLRAIPAMLQEVIEQGGHHFVHAGFSTFSASSFDFLVEFDSLSPDLAPFFEARHSVGIAIIETLAAEGIALAYPTQLAFTAAPDGSYVMPYPDSAGVSANA